MAANNKPVRRSPAKTVEDDAPQIIKLTSDPNKVDDDRIPVFAIDDAEYTIASKVKPNVALRLLHVQRLQGPEAFADLLLQTMLGDDGYEALMNFDDLTDEQLGSVFEAAMKVVGGQMEKQTPKA
jgi:hypothetical protein